MDKIIYRKRNFHSVEKNIKHLWDLWDMRKFWSKLQELPKWNLNLLPLHSGQTETRERGRYSRMVGGSFKKWSNLHRMLILNGKNMSRSLHMPVTSQKSIWMLWLGSVTHSIHMVSTTSYSLLILCPCNSS